MEWSGQEWSGVGAWGVEESGWGVEESGHGWEWAGVGPVRLC